MNNNIIDFSFTFVILYMYTILLLELNKDYNLSFLHIIMLSLLFSFIMIIMQQI